MHNTPSILSLSLFLVCFCSLIAGAYLNGLACTPCTPQVVASSPYIYLITGDATLYYWPVNNSTTARLSAISATDSIFTLPFTDTKVLRVNGWLYSTNNWHQAVDYTVDLKTAFEVKAAAAGRVIFSGWDDWSGNTVVISHDSKEGTDTYRTIYMHLRNGKTHDCDKAWSQTIPTLKGSDLSVYGFHLMMTGCTQNKADRNPNEDHWGTDEQTLRVSLNQEVKAGQTLGFSGQTGPGGEIAAARSSPTTTNNHLHIFVTRKDPTDGTFYFIDPYGIYALPSCYPSNLTGTPCATYPVTWKDGYSHYPVSSSPALLKPSWGNVVAALCVAALSLIVLV